MCVTISDLLDDMQNNPGSFTLAVSEEEKKKGKIQDQILCKDNVVVIALLADHPLRLTLQTSPSGNLAAIAKAASYKTKNFAVADSSSSSSSTGSGAQGNTTNGGGGGKSAADSAQPDSEKEAYVVKATNETTSFTTKVSSQSGEPTDADSHEHLKQLNDIQDRFVTLFTSGAAEVLLADGKAVFDSARRLNTLHRLPFRQVYRSPKEGKFTGYMYIVASRPMLAAFFTEAPLSGKLSAGDYKRMFMDNHGLEAGAAEALAERALIITNKMEDKGRQTIAARQMAQKGGAKGQNANKQRTPSQAVVSYVEPPGVEDVSESKIEVRPEHVCSGFVTVEIHLTFTQEQFNVKLVPVDIIFLATEGIPIAKPNLAYRDAMTARSRGAQFHGMLSHEQKKPLQSLQPLPRQAPPSPPQQQVSREEELGIPDEVHGISADGDEDEEREQSRRAEKEEERVAPERLTRDANNARALEKPIKRRAQQESEEEEEEEEEENNHEEDETTIVPKQGARKPSQPKRRK